MSSLDWKFMSSYLRKKGVPKSFIDDIRFALTNDAVQQSGNILIDRILTSTALMLSECLGLEHEKIFDCLNYLNALLESVGVNEDTWHDVMERLRDKTGIIVRSGDDNRFIFEYEEEEDG